MRCVDDSRCETIDPDVYDGFPQLGPAPTGDLDAPYVGDPGPHAFVVELGAARDAIQTHFHRFAQFQYVRAGSGSLGPHQLLPGTVHYTDGNTPYGPLAPGPEGLSYFTLRAIVDSGAFYMPEARDELRTRLAASSRAARSRRNLSLDLSVSGAGTSATRGGGSDGLTWRDLIHDPDGLRIAVGDVPPGGTLTTPPTDGTGVYVIVVSGAVAHDGERHDTGSYMWFDADERTTVASDAGARLGLLQFPRPDGR